MAKIYVTAKYSGPTDVRGSRIIVRWTDSAGFHRRSVPFDYAAECAFTHAVRKVFPSSVWVTNVDTPDPDFRAYVLSVGNV